MRLGGSVMKPYQNPREWLSHVQELGYSAVIFPVDSSASKETIREYKRCAEDHDLLIGEVEIWRNCMSPDLKEKEKNIEYAIRQLELAEEVGANCCVNISGSKGELWDGYHALQGTKVFYDEVVSVTQRIIDAVKPVKTCFTLEPMPWMCPESPEEYVSLMKDVDREAFKVHLDYANMICSVQIYRNADAFIQHCFDMLGPHIRSIHAKDLMIRDQILPVCIEEVQPGEGSMDLSLVLRCAGALPGDIPVFVEHLPDHDAYMKVASYMRMLADGK